MSNDELEEILNEYLSFGKIPYAKNKWGVISQIMANVYCYLHNSLFFVALTKRNDEILSMRFDDYLLEYTDEKAQFLKIDVTY